MVLSIIWAIAATFLSSLALLWLSTVLRVLASTVAITIILIQSTSCSGWSDLTLHSRGMLLYVSNQWIFSCTNSLAHLRAAVRYQMFCPTFMIEISCQRKSLRSTMRTGWETLIICRCLAGWCVVVILITPCGSSYQWTTWSEHWAGCRVVWTIFVRVTPLIHDKCGNCDKISYIPTGTQAG